MNLTYIVLIICIALCVFMFFYFKWYIKRRTSASGLIPEYRNEVYRLIAEIDAATDRDSLLVEERIKKLKEILDETDKRVSVYVKELEKSRTGEALYTSLGRGIRAALKTEPQMPPVQPPAVPQPDIPPARPAAVPPVHENSLPQSNAGTPSAGGITQAARPKRQIRAQIDLLANEGLSSEEIAKQLGISIAQVDLALELRRK